MAASPRRVVLFDLDGTLVDLAPDADDIESLRSTLCELLRLEGIAFSHTGIFPLYRTLLDSLPVEHPVVERSRAAISAAEVRWAERNAVQRCGSDLLVRLHASGSSIGLVSNNGLECIRALMRRRLLYDEWDVVVAREHVTHLKPSAEPLRLAIRSLPSIERSCYVGDSDDDERAVGELNRLQRQPMDFIRASRNRDIESIVESLCEE